MPYCAPSDLYSFGVPRGATPNPGRVVASALSNVFTLDVHGFATGEPVLFAQAGAAALPAGLSLGTTYYALPLTEHTFQVSSTPGGSAVTFTDADEPLLVVSPLPVADAIAWAQEIINDSLPAHVVPISDDAVPAIVKMTCAELAAGKLLGLMGAMSTSLSDTVDRAQKRLARWAGGVPIRGAEVPPPANNAAAYVAPCHTDRRGWGRYGGT